MAVLTFLLFLLLSPPEALKGTILDATGAAIAGARVEISGAGLSRSAITVDAGVFVIVDARSGTWSLRVIRGGLTHHASSLHMPSDSLKLTRRVAPRFEHV